MSDRPADRMKPKYSEINLSECPFAHQEFYIKWPGIEPDPSSVEASKTRVNNGKVHPRTGTEALYRPYAP